MSETFRFLQAGALLLILFISACAISSQKYAKQVMNLNLEPTADSLEAQLRQMVKCGKEGNSSCILQFFPPNENWKGWVKEFTRWLESSSGDLKILVCRVEGDIGVTYFKVRRNTDFLPLDNYEDELFLFWKWSTGMKRWLQIEMIEKYYNHNERELTRWQRYLDSMASQELHPEDLDEIKLTAKSFVEAAIAGKDAEVRHMISRYEYSRDAHFSWSLDFFLDEETSWTMECFKEVNHYTITPIKNQYIRSGDYDAGRSSISCNTYRSDDYPYEYISVPAWEVKVHIVNKSGKNDTCKFYLVKEDGLWRVWYIPI